MTVFIKNKLFKNVKVWYEKKNKLILNDLNLGGVDCGFVFLLKVCICSLVMTSDH